MNRLWFLSASPLITIVIALMSVSCIRFSGNGFHSSWEKYPDSRWTGPELWANRLADWEVKDGRLSCQTSQPFRTVYLTTRKINSLEGDFITLVNVRRNGNGTLAGDAAAGYLIGTDYFIGLDGLGRVFIRDFAAENHSEALTGKGSATWSEAIIKLTAISTGPETTGVTIIAVDPSTGTVISEIKEAALPSLRLAGNIALVSHAGYGAGKAGTFSFAHWIIRGSRIEANRENRTGPLVTAQYTLSHSILKLTAQLMPIEKKLCDSVELQFADEDKWQTTAVASVDTPSYTASFRIENWNTGEDKPFRLIARYRFGHEEENSLKGMIKHNPVEKDQLKILALSRCKDSSLPYQDKRNNDETEQFQPGEGILFPLMTLTASLEKEHADLLFFAGDKVNEKTSPTEAEHRNDAVLDYLHNWYLWCISFRDLTTVIPSITIPDYQDMSSGNARYVNAVLATQARHLPDHAEFQPAAEQETEPYSTECNLGGVGFAVIDDSKFKSEYQENNPDQWQYTFLEKWADDWSGGTWMKVVLSQSLWSGLASLPDSVFSHDAQDSLPGDDSAAYMIHDRTISELDSDTWPRSGMNRALKIIRKGFALHIAGGSYPASTFRYSSEKPGDAGYVITTPSTGYGTVLFDRKTREIELANWPGYVNPQTGSPLPGWPVKVTQADNYGRAIVAWLPEIVVEGMTDPVIRVVSEPGGEIIYTLRINGSSFQPGVFSYGMYTVEAGDPDKGVWKKIENLAAWSAKERQKITITF